MSNLSDFIIENGVLKKYVGPGGDVVAPEGVTEIAGGFEAGAFDRCKGLTSVTLQPGLVKIGELAFNRCENLKTVIIPKGVKKLPFGVFHDCSNLENVTLPDGITEIGNEAFCGCIGLKKIKLPESVLAIGERAFQNCKKLTAITIPKGVEQIGKYAFLACNKLKTLSVMNNHTVLQKEVFGSKMPKDLIPGILEIMPNIADGAVKQYILDRKVWASLDTDTQVSIFLARQGKILSSAYEKCISEDQVDQFGKVLLSKLQPDLSVTECNAAVSFMELFSTKASTELIKELYEQIKQCKNGAKALKRIENDLVLSDLLFS